MSSDDHLLGKIEEYMEWSKNEISLIRQDVKDLAGFKWKVTGIASVVAFIISALAHYLIVKGGRSD